MKMITISSWARASTKPGQMSMLERREVLCVTMARGVMRSASALLGEGGDGACEDADLRAQLLNALGAALRHVLGQAREVGLDVAQMAAQHVVVPDRALGDIGEAGQ